MADEDIGVAMPVVEETTSSESTAAKQQGDGKQGTPAQAVTREREAGWGDYFR